jgi:hypothetical protein
MPGAGDGDASATANWGKNSTKRTSDITATLRQAAMLGILQKTLRMDDSWRAASFTDDSSAMTNGTVPVVR